MPPPFILGLKNILDRNDKSELVPHLENSVRIIISWSEWRDLNPRPHGPEPCALPTALHPVSFFIIEAPAGSVK